MNGGSIFFTQATNLFKLVLKRQPSHTQVKTQTVTNRDYGFYSFS